MSSTIQNSYGKREKGFLGGVANSNPVTRRSEVAEEQIATGKFAKYSGTGGLINLSTDSTVAGVVAKTDAIQGATVEANQNTTLITKGSVFAYCETDCTKDATVYARFTANGSLAVGNVRKDADTDKAGTVKATFAETLTTAGLVEIELNL